MGLGPQHVTSRAGAQFHPLVSLSPGLSGYLTSSRLSLNSPTGRVSRGPAWWDPFSLTTQGGIPTLKESLLSRELGRVLLCVGPPHALHTRALEAALGQHAVFHGVLDSLLDRRLLSHL